jgi:hypothetical protein
MSGKFDSTKNVCVGIAKGDKCDMTMAKACEAGLYCGNAGVCEEITLKVGDSCAGKYNGCPFFTQCHTQDLKSYTCTGFYTLENGASIANGNEYLCKSATATGESGNKMCSQGPQFTGDSRKMTNPQSICTYSIGTKTHTETSLCGYNATPDSYCPFLGGDMTSQDLFIYSTIP